MRDCKVGEDTQKQCEIAGHGTVTKKTGKSKTPEILAVPFELPEPFGKAPPTASRTVQTAKRIGHRRHGMANQKKHRQHHVNDVGAIMLVGNTKVGQKTHRTPATTASVPMDAEVANPILQGCLPLIVTVVVQGAGVAVRKGTAARARRPQITPMIKVILNITAERNKLFAWLRGGWIVVLSQGHIQYSPKPILTNYPANHPAN
jgi:hypothetical protein